MADIRPDRLTICQSERKSIVSRRPSVLFWSCKNVEGNLNLLFILSKLSGKFNSRIRAEDFDVYKNLKVHLKLNAIKPVTNFLQMSSDLNIAALS
jgi:hypothetical protein